jgi:DNA polymerase epsilon subunit 1
MYLWKLPLKDENAHANSANAGFDLFDDSRDNDKRLNTTIVDASDFIVDMREWDVPYHVRVLIDKGKLCPSSSDIC